MRNSVDSGAECMIGNECMTTGCMNSECMTTGCMNSECMNSECMTSECMTTECMIGKTDSLSRMLNVYHNQQGYQNGLSASKKRGRWSL